MIPWEKAYELSLAFPENDIIKWRFMKSVQLMEFLRPKVKETFVSGIKKTSRTKRVKRMKSILLKYGKDVFKDLKSAKNIPYITLQSVAEKHGFSREYARQLYEFVYLDTYTNAHNKKMLTVEETQCPHNPAHKVAEYKKDSLKYKGAIAEKLFMNKCEALGFDVLIPCKPMFDIIVNKWLIDVKSCTKLTKTRPDVNTLYNHFHISPKQRSLCHFFALHSGNSDCFFIVPNKEFGHAFDKQKSIYIADKKSNDCRAKNKYFEYKNRFDLLENKNETTGEKR